MLLVVLVAGRSDGVMRGGVGSEILLFSSMHSEGYVYSWHSCSANLLRLSVLRHKGRHGEAR